jgi:hypothetical protein
MAVDGRIARRAHVSLTSCISRDWLARVLDRDPRSFGDTVTETFNHVAHWLETNFGT